jgi:nitrate/nitrite transporter NarK
VRSIGYIPTHLLIAAGLVVVGAVLWLLMRDSPAWKPNLAPVVPKVAGAGKLPLTWQMSFLYAVTFGGFVAFSTYLPTYLKNVYTFGLTGAGTRTAGFAIAAVIARPIGGIMADKIGPRKVVVGACGGLGGFFPPLVMGATYNEAEHSYTIGLVLLTITAAAALLFTLFGIRRRTPART